MSFVKPVIAAAATITIVRTTNQRSLQTRVTSAGRRSRHPRRTQRYGRLCFSSGGKNGNLKSTSSGRNMSPPRTVMSAARWGRRRKKSEIDTGTESAKAIWEKRL